MRLTPTPFRTSLTNPRYKAESSNSNLELEVIAPSKVATSYNIHTALLFTAQTRHRGIKRHVKITDRPTV